MNKTNEKKIKKQNQGKTLDELKRFFLEMRIIKDNFRITIITICIFSIYFIAIGLFMIIQNNKIQEFSHRIDDRCLNNSCSINFQIHHDMKGPIYVYLSFKDFYVNHRKVINSVDYSQLAGTILSKNDSDKNCSNFNLNKHGMLYYPKFFENLPQEEVMHPCGLFPLLYQQCNIKS